VVVVIAGSADTMNAEVMEVPGYHSMAYKKGSEK